MTVLFFISIVSASWNTRDYMKREHSLIKPYQGESLASKFPVCRCPRFMPCHETLVMTSVSGRMKKRRPAANPASGQGEYHTGPSIKFEKQKKVCARGADLSGSGFGRGGGGPRVWDQANRCDQGM